MGLEQEENAIKGELPLATRPVQPTKVSGFAYRRRAISVGAFIGVALWLVHGRHRGFASEPWLEGRFDLFGHHKSGPLTGREAEELFL